VDAPHTGSHAAVVMKDRNGAKHYVTSTMFSEKRKRKVNLRDKLLPKIGVQFINGWLFGLYFTAA
jgi:hypothetical protein